MSLSLFDGWLMRLLLTLFIPTVLLGLGCNDDDTYEPWPVYVTPNGYRFEFKDRGSIEFGWLDVVGEFERTAEAAALELWNVHGIPLGETRAVLRSYWIRVIDAFLFATPSSPTRYAAGAIEPQNRKMYLALYRRQRNDSGPSWTHFTWPSTGETHSGIPSSPYLPALTHELLHHFGLIPGSHRESYDRVHATEVEP